MPDTQGGKYLPAAVTQFINIFDETLDRAALVSFSYRRQMMFPWAAKNGKFKAPIYQMHQWLHMGRRYLFDTPV